MLLAICMTNRQTSVEFRFLSWILLNGFKLEFKVAATAVAAKRHSCCCRACPCTIQPVRSHDLQNFVGGNSSCMRMQLETNKIFRLACQPELRSEYDRSLIIRLNYLLESLDGRCDHQPSRADQMPHICM